MADEDTGAARTESVLDAFTPEEQIAIYNRARRRAWGRMSIIIHAIIYVCVIGFLTILNYSASPEYLWVVWPAGGWGFGLFAHWFAVSRMPRLASEWEEREIIRELEKRG